MKEDAHEKYLCNYVGDTFHALMKGRGLDALYEIWVGRKDKFCP